MSTDNSAVSAVEAFILSEGKVASEDVIGLLVARLGCLVEEDAAALRIIKSGNGDGFMRTDEYVEAQITGGISVMDVAEIFVPEELVERVRRIMPSSLANRVIAVPYGVDDFINRDLAYDKLHDKALVERYRNNAVEGTDMVTGSGVAAGRYGD